MLIQNSCVAGMNRHHYMNSGNVSWSSPFRGSGDVCRKFW